MRVTPQQSEEIKRFCAERDRVLRALDVPMYEAFLRAQGVILPEQWARPDVPIASMHKARLHLNAFTAEEKAASRAWLAANGYTEDVG
jgi:hypothetical protein